MNTTQRISLVYLFNGIPTPHGLFTTKICKCLIIIITIHLILIIYTQWYDFKYSYLIQIIHHLFAHGYIVSSIFYLILIILKHIHLTYRWDLNKYYHFGSAIQHTPEHQNWSLPTGCSFVLYSGCLFLWGEVFTPLQVMQSVNSESCQLEGRKTQLLY